MTYHIPRKRFGQHFLHDRHVIHDIIAAISPETHENIIEIGPGLGALTIELLQQIGHLTAIELDRDLIEKLTLACKSYGELQLIHADALSYDYAQLISPSKPLRIVGNLPYNISTPLLFHLLNYAHDIIDMHFMLQKEVVDRIVAEVGSADYGRLSVMLQYHCAVDALFTVDPSAFSPPPAVNSAVIRLMPYKNIERKVNDIKQFSMVVAEAFNQRRKTLRNCLKRIVNVSQLEKLGINPEFRPQQLTVNDFVKISNAVWID